MQPAKEATRLSSLQKIEADMVPPPEQKQYVEAVKPSMTVSPMRYKVVNVTESGEGSQQNNDSSSEIGQ